MARGLNAPTRDSLKMLPLCAESDQLAVHTVGGVISNGETITQIVPRADDLVAEAKMASNDIDQVAVGRRRWCASHGRGNQRTTPEVAGTVIRVSADLALPLAMAQAPGMRVANLGSP